MAFPVCCTAFLPRHHEDEDKDITSRSRQKVSVEGTTTTADRLRGSDCIQISAPSVVGGAATKQETTT
jgi:hypothetical protein